MEEEPVRISGLEDLMKVKNFAEFSETPQGNIAQALSDLNLLTIGYAGNVEHIIRDFKLNSARVSNASIENGTVRKFHDILVRLYDSANKVPDSERSNYSFIFLFYRQKNLLLQVINDLWRNVAPDVQMQYINDVKNLAGNAHISKEIREWSELTLEVMKKKGILDKNGNITENRFKQVFEKGYSLITVILNKLGSVPNPPGQLKI